MQINPVFSMMRNKILVASIAMLATSIIIWIGVPFYIQEPYMEHGTLEAFWIWQIFEDISHIPLNMSPYYVSIFFSSGLVSLIVVALAFATAAQAVTTHKTAAHVDYHRLGFLTALMMFASTVVIFGDLAMLKNQSFPLTSILMFSYDTDSNAIFWINVLACYIPRLVPAAISLLTGIYSLKLLAFQPSEVERVNA